MLGRLNPAKLLSVADPVSVDYVRERIMVEVGRPLKLSAEEAAAAILRIANDKMAGAIRMVSLARGHDPRDFALFAFGGAGPLHACALASELGIPQVLIPARPGLTNALGCTVADLRHDYVSTINQPVAMLEEGHLERVFKEHAARGATTLADEGVAVEKVVTQHRADMQFQGQSHLLTVPLASAAVTLPELRALFEAAYWQRFGVELPEIRAVLVNLHTAVIGKRRAVDLRAIAAREPRATLSEAQQGSRAVWFAQAGTVETPVYRREWLPDAAQIEGPAIIEQLDCTTVIEPGWRARVDEVGNLMLQLQARRAMGALPFSPT